MENLKMESSVKKCKICGSELCLSLSEHYVARDNKKKDSGVAAAFAMSTETNLFDCVDCLVCGCQNVLNQRMREFDDYEDIPYEEDYEEDIEIDELHQRIEMQERMLESKEEEIEKLKMENKNLRSYRLVFGKSIEI